MLSSITAEVVSPAHPHTEPRQEVRQIEALPRAARRRQGMAGRIDTRQTQEARHD